MGFDDCRTERRWSEAEIDALRTAANTLGTAIERDRAENERARLEAQIHQVHKWESLGVLASGIAHDFNNLLVGILGNADLALMDLPPTSPLRPLLEEIQTAGLRASELTRQMTAYAGKGQLAIEAVDLDRLIEEMTQLLLSSIP